MNDVSTKYEVIIGLETHVELSTVTKMFCGCKLSFGADLNTYTCPVCLGLPGSLPVINKKAIEYAIKIAIALNCKINKHTIFHRKNYFYPDMPKNYQISQYDMPIGSSGYLDVDFEGYTRRVRITRVHIEEDTGKLIHTGATGRISESDSSIVDFNRAGTPLVEIVTEPDIKSPAEAKEYLISLRNLILYLGVSNCNMEEGSLRCDANVSVKAKSDLNLGTKTEIKNLNSFRFLQRGLEYEVERQIAIIEAGNKVVQQTRHYDHITDTTKPLRTKEEAHDYRYFPEPDLVPMLIDENMVERIKSEIPELPYDKAKRYKSQYLLPAYDCKFLVSSKDISDYFEKCIEIYNNPKAISNWIMGDFSALLNKEDISIKDSKVKPENLCKILKMVEEGRISLKIAKSVFEEMFYSQEEINPEKIIKEKGLEQISDESFLEDLIEKVIKSYPETVEEYKSGKDKAIGFLIGQVMSQTKGKANPRLVSEIMVRKLKA